MTCRTSRFYVLYICSLVLNLFYAYRSLSVLNYVGPVGAVCSYIKSVGPVGAVSPVGCYKTSVDPVGTWVPWGQWVVIKHPWVPCVPCVPWVRCVPWVAVCSVGRRVFRGSRG